MGTSVRCSIEVKRSTNLAVGPSCGTTQVLNILRYRNSSSAGNAVQSTGTVHRQITAAAGYRGVYAGIAVLPHPGSGSVAAVDVGNIVSENLVCERTLRIGGQFSKFAADAQFTAVVACAGKRLSLFPSDIPTGIHNLECLGRTTACINLQAGEVVLIYIPFDFCTTGAVVGNIGGTEIRFVVGRKGHIVLQSVFPSSGADTILGLGSQNQLCRRSLLDIDAETG